MRGSTAHPLLVSQGAMAAAREAALALRARLASGLAAGPAGHVRGFTASAALGRFRRGPDHTVRYEDGACGRALCAA